MKYCSVPGCRSKAKDKLHNLIFFNLPNERKDGVVNPLKRKRRLEWVKALQATKLSKRTLNNLLICSKHFTTGRPAKAECIGHRDWIPTLDMPHMAVCNESVEKIIKSLPEVVDNFDVPEYIFLDKVKFNEKKIEEDLIQKYITNAVCDENGYYKNDHDYLGLPVFPRDSETPRENLNKEHGYALTNKPACLTFIWRHFCNICSTNCLNLFSFNNHMMAHTLKNDVKCVLCCKKFMTSWCLNNHLTTHLGRCKVCGHDVPKVQLSSHQLVNKNQKLQNHEIVKYQVPANRRIYFCVPCLRKFKNGSEYQDHMYLHKKHNKTKNGKVS